MANFDLAWNFTLTQEVGPHWASAPEFSPSNVDVAAGSTDTAFKRKKVGYRGSDGFAGNIKKFGIVQGPNWQVNIETLTYAQARAQALSAYWNTGYTGVIALPSPASLEATRPRTAMMVFDTSFLNGKGNTAFIYQQAQLDGLDDLQACANLNQQQELLIQQLLSENPSRNRLLKKWVARARDLYTFATTAQLGG